MTFIIAKILLTAFLVVGFIAVFFNLFGTFIILIASFIFAIFDHFRLLSPNTLILLSILAITGEFLEFITVATIARRFGAAKEAAWSALIGAIVGGFIGSVLLGIIGAILGSLIGLFAAAFIVEAFLKRKMKDAFKAGAGGITGRFIATLLKATIAASMVIIIILRIF